MLSEKSYELIEKYLDNTLSADEATEFKDSLSNKEFREQLALQASLVDSLVENEKAKLVSDIKSHVSSDSTVKQIQPKKTRTLWPLSIAAGLALFLAAFFVMKMFTPNHTEALYAEHFRPYPPAVIERGQGADLDAVFKDAMKAYVSEDYKSALPLFEKLGPDNNKILLYKAMSLMKLDQDEKAKELLSTLVASTDKSSKENGEWYLALIYIKQNQVQRAIDLLNPISQDGDHLFARDAKGLLVKLMSK